MPVLEITPEMVGPSRTQLATNYIFSVMLWPAADDESERAEWMRTCRASYIRQAILGAPAAMRTVEPSEWLAWHDQALDAMPPRIWSDRTEKRYRYGLFAGELLGEAVRQYVGGNLKLESLKSAMTAPQRQKAHKWLDISLSTLNNTIWRRFRCVASLWSSHAYKTLVLHEPMAYPCRLDELPDFLGLADFFAQAGLAAKMPRRKDHLLDERTMWRIPSGLPLPRFEIEWGDRPRLF